MRKPLMQDIYFIKVDKHEPFYLVTEINQDTLPEVNIVDDEFYLPRELKTVDSCIERSEWSILIYITLALSSA